MKFYDDALKILIDKLGEDDQKVAIVKLFIFISLLNFLIY